MTKPKYKFEVVNYTVNESRRSYADSQENTSNYETYPVEKWRVECNGISIADGFSYAHQAQEFIENNTSVSSVLKIHKEKVLNEKEIGILKQFMILDENLKI